MSEYKEKQIKIIIIAEDFNTPFSVIDETSSRKNQSDYGKTTNMT